MTDFDPNKMIIVYDGECPFCRNYVRLTHLRKNIGEVELVNAREQHPAVRHLVERNFDLNEGMAAIYGGKIYYGEEAVTFLSTLSNGEGFANRMLAIILRNPTRAKILYPWMRFGRSVALKLLRKPLILWKRP